ncbi:MAG: bacteriohemerythrin [Gammaproteobacteria bacterium]|nr:bacteriohemerythrin [Gammaproteobacteria bacterium]
MSMIEWKDEFSVGIPDVDHEHQQLIGLINELHNAMSGKNAAMTVTDFLGEIHAHVAAHFALEEKIMREKKYDQYEDHKRDHERLLDEISDIMDDYEENAFYSDEVFTSTLEHWFSDHFKTRDARLHKHLGV